MGNGPNTYAAAGVDIAAANQTKQRIKELVRSTHRPGVLGDMGGGFGGLFAPAWQEFEEPVLVSSVDSVGTKLKLAFLSGRHDTVGMDIVFHCANDILVQGARPLFFLDYLGMGRHEPQVAEDLVRGLAQGCKAIDCALIGGETAELPGFYRDGEYDLAGTIVGMVDRAKIIDGRHIRPGDCIVGLASDGLHTNGYSLARRVVLEQGHADLDTPFAATGRTFGEEMLRPHRCYVKPVHQVLGDFDIRGLVHITGGGFWDNIPRILPEGLGAAIRRGTWSVPPIFSHIQVQGKIDEREMYHVFNMGIGMMAIVPVDQAAGIVEALSRTGEQVQVIGEIVADQEGVRLVD